MFTGIITHIGTVRRIRKSGDWIFTIGAPGFAGDAALGASIAHSGACLTIIRNSGDEFDVQVSKETLDRTTLGGWAEGTQINLERALKVGDELGGHYVTGHVDGVATIEALKPAQESTIVTISAPMELSRFVAAKGSVTLDGVSLTVNTAAKNLFTVNIIPHTQANTTLAGWVKGRRINLEIDIIARYLARMQEKS